MEGERETILTALEFIKTGSPSLNIDLNGGGWCEKSMNFADLSRKFHRNRINGSRDSRVIVTRIKKKESTSLYSSIPQNRYHKNIHTLYSVFRARF